MSVPVGRNVVVPALFIACALAATVALAVNVRLSFFLLAVGFAVSTMVYVLWHDAPVPVALVAPGTDTARPESTARRSAGAESQF